MLTADLSETIAGLRSEADLHPNDADRRRVLADALEDAGQADEAARERRHADEMEPMPTLWESVTYRSRYGRVVDRRLTIAAATRREAVAIIRHMAAIAAPRHSAAHEHARLVVGGGRRATLKKIYRGEFAVFAAGDGTWRKRDYGRNVVYARWDR